MRVVAHLWAGDDPPVEYVTLVLCRDVYHCPPSVLKRERLVDVLPHLTCLRAETLVRQQEMRRGRD